MFTDEHLFFRRHIPFHTNAINFCPFSAGLLSKMSSTPATPASCSILPLPATRGRSLSDVTKDDEVCVRMLQTARVVPRNQTVKRASNVKRHSTMSVASNVISKPGGSREPNKMATDHSSSLYVHYPTFP